MPIPSLTLPSATRVAQASPAGQKLYVREIKGSIRELLTAFINKIATNDNSATTMPFKAVVPNGSNVTVTKQNKGFLIYSTDDQSPIYLEDLQAVINHIYDKVTTRKKTTRG